MKKLSLILVLGFCLVFLAGQAAADIQVVPLSYDFGIVPVGDSATAIITITNVPGNVMEPLLIFGIDLEQGSSPDFEITVNPEGAELQFGESVDIEITFTPSSDGYVSAILVIDSLDHFYPQAYVLLSGGPVSVQCAEIPICTDPARQDSTAISGHRVVWSDYRNVYGGHIYMYDLATGIETQINTDPGGQWRPAISGDRIVWQHNSLGPGDIYMHDLATGTGIPICTDPAGQAGPAISGDRIVWQDRRNGNLDIYMYDLSTGNEIPICTDPAVQGAPAISGDRIVWEDNRNGNIDIYMYDLATAIETPICSDTNHQRNPAISGDRIVWEDNRNKILDIYMYDLATSQETQITTDPQTQRYVAISGDRIVWEDYRNGNADIYMYDLAAGTETQITTHPAHQGYRPAISGVRIAWVDERNLNRDIYLYTLIPDLEVSPAVYDFGDVDVGDSSTTIVTISNVGDLDLTVSDISFAAGSSSDFAIISSPSLPAVVEPDDFFDVGLAFAPSAQEYVEATLEILSDDQCEPLVQVPLGGVGVSQEPPPDEQIAEILDFFDAAVEAETLSGDGPGNSAENRLNALRNMLEAAGDLIEDGEIEMACEQLASALKKTDGDPKPPDFVTGDAASELAARIVALRATLGCE